MRSQHWIFVSALIINLMILTTPGAMISEISMLRQSETKSHRS